jgi:hypothetical protein
MLAELLDNVVKSFSLRIFNGRFGFSVFKIKPRISLHKA